MNIKVKSYILLLFSVFLLTHSFVYSQVDVTKKDSSSFNPDQKIDMDLFNPGLMSAAVLSEMNKARLDMGLDELKSDEMLTVASKEICTIISKKDEAKLIDPDETGRAVMKAGGTKNAVELLARMPLKKSADMPTYRSFANGIITKWQASAKSASVLTSVSCLIAGVSTIIDDKGNKVFVAAILGNYKTYNKGVGKIKELPEPLKLKIYGVGNYDEKVCKKLESWNNQDLQKNLFVKDNIIYFKHDNLKELKRLIRRDSKDGFAVDVIQKAQYPCDSANIVDNNLFIKGIMTKPVFANQLYDNNQLEGKEAKTKLKVELGELPDGIEKNYELNLILIKDNIFCRNMPQPFLFNAGIKATHEIEKLNDTVTVKTTSEYIPKAKSEEFLFRINFKQNKLVYTGDDFQPHLDSLKVPDYVINELDIVAYSSIEASETKNMITQHKRAESIMDIFKKLQTEPFENDILTTNSWNLFKIDVIGTEYAYLATISLKDAQKNIKDNKLESKLEPIFEKERFAQVEMKVTFDLRGDKEQGYVLWEFNNAVKKQDLPLAFSIQKYIMKKVLAKKYDEKAVTTEKIPIDAKYVSLLMNKLWMQAHLNLIKEDEYGKQINKLYQLDPLNIYISFNQLLYDVKSGPLGDDVKIYKNQTRLDKLYVTPISKESLDNLNLDYQFRIVTALDTLTAPSQTLTESLNRIKAIVKLNASDWKNSLQLAYTFMNHHDYEFALKLLEVFVDDKNVNEELLFTYISLCSYSSEIQMTNKFVRAMKKADELDHKRYCSLFDGKHFTVQVFENPLVKETYCKSCGKK
ncbi:MAG: hypothetical protein NTW49_10395 [Bacteroidia bacterium]|nr:hypothetical protein [Bacteroidia bacterium]